MGARQDAAGRSSSTARPARVVRPVVVDEHTGQRLDLRRVRIAARRRARGYDGGVVTVSALDVARARRPPKSQAASTPSR